MSTFQVTEPSVSETLGVAFAAVDSTHAAQCSSYLGRNCVLNTW
jgi:hypothetical protein